MVAADPAAQAGVWGRIKSVVPGWRRPATLSPSTLERPSLTQLAKQSPAGSGMHVQAATLEAQSAPKRESQCEAASNSPSGAQNSSNADTAPSFGYARGVEQRYRVEKKLGKGGNGVVRLVTELATGQQFAMKSIPKVLTDPSLSEIKRREHANAIQREVDVLRRLRGCLNVAALEEVYEDDTHVHLVMEYCSGGELHHAIGDRHYSERTVASYMRAVLRTLAQCHSQNILHRDIKPGNFLLASGDERAPLKAIDFGLAVFFEDGRLPRTDLGLEGTPWFMAPEALRSEVLPASDVWAAGVMAHQLLTGRFPFDDRQNPFAPSLSKVWRSILGDQLDFKHRSWEGVSEEAKSFVAFLLNKDPAQRPTAAQALAHPWLKGSIAERSKGRPLALGVVQRIQRFSQGSVFKRTVLEHIADELLRQQAGRKTSELVEGAVCRLGAGGRPVIDDPQASALEYLYQHLSLADVSTVDRAAVAEGLEELGYRLSPDELDRLLDQLDPGNTGNISKAQVAASQLDWGSLQQNQTELWLECARKAFAELDTDGNGRITPEDMVAYLRNKLPPAEVQAAVRHAMLEAKRRSEGSRHGGPHASGNNRGSQGSMDECEAGGTVHSNGSGSADDSMRAGLTFKHFVRVLRAGSSDSLDLYDDRLGSSFGSPGNSALSLAAADASLRGADRARPQLEPIPERA